MANDLFLSKRGYNQRCLWWSRSENDEYEPDELISKRIPTGSFYAKEVSPQTATAEMVGDSFMFNKNTVTLKSADNLWEMKKNDLIEYCGEKWIVDNVQKPKARPQNSFFSTEKGCSHFYYIELRK